MKLQKAIEILTYSRKYRTILATNDDGQALTLAIEALKWRQLMEHDYASWVGPLLPGED